MIERLRRLFDLLDPMPEAAVVPVDMAWDRLEVVPELATRGSSRCFQRADLVVHVEVGTVLRGMVAGVDEVEIRWPQGATWAAVDSRGLFESADVPPGPVRLVIGDAATDWFVR
jgi:hypothetical protein